MIKLLVAAVHAEDNFMKTSLFKGGVIDKWKWMVKL